MTAPTDEQKETGATQPGERIGWLRLPAEAELPEGVQSLIRKAREKIGFVPNVFRAFALRPEHLQRWRAHFTELTTGESELSQAEREMIAVVVSSENHCLYCSTSHGAGLRQLVGDPVLADRIALDHRRAGLDARTTAMLDYAVKITRAPVECNEEDIDRLRALGFCDEGIFDIAETAAMYNFTNRLVSATGMLPNREYHALGR